MSNPLGIGLIPPKPGEVRNPNGRPKGALDMSTRVKRIMRMKIDWDKIHIADTTKLRERYGDQAVADAMIWIQVSKALTGDTKAFDSVRKAGWGDLIKGEIEEKLDVVHIYRPDKLDSIEDINRMGRELRERANAAVEGELVNEPPAMDSAARTADVRFITAGLC